uniref:Uncharacterized protein n=1 Tax=Arundo donax TaxID=35708 RepID=A0A0A9ACD1_ARUDO
MLYIGQHRCISLLTLYRKGYNKL